MNKWLQVERAGPAFVVIDVIVLLPLFLLLS